MRESTKEVIAPLLRALRAYSRIEEVRDCEFFLDGRDFIHFHETEDGVVADVLLSKGRVSMAASTAQHQDDLLDRIESRLESLEHHARRRDGKGHRSGRHPARRSE